MMDGNLNDVLEPHYPTLECNATPSYCKLKDGRSSSFKKELRNFDIKGKHDKISHILLEIPPSHELYFFRITLCDSEKIQQVCGGISG